LARIAGIDLPPDKRIIVALTYIYGIGRTTSVNILGKTGIPEDTRSKDLTDADTGKLRQVIENDLPVNGQRTKTNARTRKGPKRRVGAKRK